MYSKSNGAHGTHCWIPTASLVTEISNVLVQLFWHNEREDSTEYLSISELWNLSRSQQGQLNKRFALLNGASVLCLLGAPNEAFSQNRHLHGQANEIYRMVDRHLVSVHAAVVELSKRRHAKSNNVTFGD